MSELEKSDLITLLYDARSRIGAIKSHADRLHLAFVAMKTVQAQQNLLEATHKLENENEPIKSVG